MYIRAHEHIVCIQALQNKHCTCSALDMHIKRHVRVCRCESNYAYGGGDNNNEKQFYNAINLSFSF